MLTEKQISSPSCSCCQSSKSKKLYDVYDHEYRTTEQLFPLVQCSDCETIYLSPRPNLTALDVIYPKTYNNFHTGGEKVSHVRRISNRLQAMRLKKLIGSYVNTDAFSVLDVGCGDGFSLDRILEVFPNARTFGVEPNHEAASAASLRHNVFHGLIEDYASDMKFDLIVSSHVIEHVAEPFEFLSKLKGLLKPGGVMIIDTPNVDCYQSRLFGRHWGGIHAPRHWTLFSKTTLSQLATKVGLRTVLIQEMPINTFWVWSVHSALYARQGLRSFADRFFDPVKCVASPSLYYLGVMVVAEVLERVTSLFGLGLGQQRAVLTSQV